MSRLNGSSKERDDDRHYDPMRQIEIERLHSYIVNSMLGRMFQSPLHSPRRMLEVGCSMGVATCQLGNMFPSAEVIGVDMKLAALPLISSKPANVNLFQGDIHQLALTESTFAAGSQDFIYSRLVMIEMREWKGYIQKAFHMLKPGGYLEVQEEDVDWFIDGKSITGEWDWWKFYYGENSLEDFQCAKNAAGWMEAAGFVNVQVRKYQWPWGNWAANQGHIETLSLATHVAANHGAAFLDNLLSLGEVNGYSYKAIAKLQAECKRTLEGEGEKYQEFYVTWGQKPLAEHGHGFGDQLHRDPEGP